SVDSQALYGGRPSAYLKYVSVNPPVGGGFGTLMQSFNAKQYNGQRVRFSAYVKSEAVQNWAGLWMRVDKVTNDKRQVVAFDNMQDRAIKGTTGWQHYEVVLDVPDDSTLIALGILVDGSGTVWLNSGSFEVVSKSIPVTGKSVPTPDGPQNLSLDK
ncbi:MAG: AraC family transcriptional regulator, partial [Acidobacteriia bacterium]|nr:AraC family transcriptional regulator [Terriglobia bacterium]